jgi:GNAT acetyltransferase-like protein
MVNGQSTVEIRFKGNWVTVPAVDVDGESLIASGKWLRIAKVRGEEMMERELENPELYIKALKGDARRALRADIFTFTQKVPASCPRYSYPLDWESVAAIPLTTFTQWWEGLPQETRKNVRRAQKRGVEVQLSDYDDELIQGIRDVNDDCPMRQGTPNAYYGKSFEDTKRLYGDFIGRCDFICAYHGDQLIGFLHLVYRGEIASILNLTTAPSHFDKRPANALVAKAVEICAAKRLSYVTYGLYNYGNKHDHPLRTFKIRNGFTELRMPRYFVPLTRWGRVCMTADLHLGLVGLLPHPVIALAVGARAQWYRCLALVSRRSSKAERPNRKRQMERPIPPAGSST